MRVIWRLVVRSDRDLLAGVLDGALWRICRDVSLAGILSVGTWGSTRLQAKVFIRLCVGILCSGGKGITCFCVSALHTPV